MTTTPPSRRCRSKTPTVTSKPDLAKMIAAQATPEDRERLKLLMSKGANVKDSIKDWVANKLKGKGKGKGKSVRSGGSLMAPPSSWVDREPTLHRSNQTTFSSPDSQVNPPEPVNAELVKRHGGRTFFQSAEAHDEEDLADEAVSTKKASKKTAKNDNTGKTKQHADGEDPAGETPTALAKKTEKRPAKKDDTGKDAKNSTCEEAPHDETAPVRKARPKNTDKQDDAEPDEAPAKKPKKKTSENDAAQTGKKKPTTDEEEPCVDTTEMSAKQPKKKLAKKADEGTKAPVAHARKMDKTPSQNKDVKTTTKDNQTVEEEDDETLAKEAKKARNATKKTEKKTADTEDAEESTEEDSDDTTEAICKMIHDGDGDSASDEDEAHAIEKAMFRLMEAEGSKAVHLLKKMLLDRRRRAQRRANGRKTQKPATEDIPDGAESAPKRKKPLEEDAVKNKKKPKKNEEDPGDEVAPAKKARGKTKEDELTRRKKSKKDKEDAVDDEVAPSKKTKEDKLTRSKKSKKDEEDPADEVAPSKKARGETKEKGNELSSRKEQQADEEDADEEEVASTRTAKGTTPEKEDEMKSKEKQAVDGEGPADEQQVAPAKKKSKTVKNGKETQEGETYVTPKKSKQHHPDEADTQELATPPVAETEVDEEDPWENWWDDEGWDMRDEYYEEQGGEWVEDDPSQELESQLEKNSGEKKDEDAGHPSNEGTTPGGSPAATTEPTSSPTSVVESSHDPAEGKNCLRRSSTSTTVDFADGHGTVKLRLAVRDTDGKLRRVKNLSPEQKECLQQLTNAGQLDIQERRMLYSAMDRRFSAGDMPPALLQKYYEAAGSHTKKFQLLKEWLCADEMRDVNLEGSIEQSKKDQNYEVFVEMTLLDIEAKYGGTESGRKFIDKLKATQKGRAHPDPGFKKDKNMRLYKIFKHVEHKSGHENTASTKIYATGTLPTGPGGVDGETEPATSTAPATGTGAVPATGAAPATGTGAAPATGAALAITGSGAVVATGDASSTNECPRMALGTMLDQMAVVGPKHEKAKKAEKSDDEDSDSESDSEGDGKKKKQKNKKPKGPKEVSPEVKAQRERKAKLQKINRACRALAGKVRNAAQELGQFKGHEELKDMLKNKHSWVNDLAEEMESMAINGKTDVEIEQFWKGKQAEVEELEDRVESAKGAARTLRSRQRRRESKVAASEVASTAALEDVEED